LYPAHAAPAPGDLQRQLLGVVARGVHCPADAERWCAARLYPYLPLREAVALLTDSTPIQPPPPMPGLPPTREQQQQARRLAEAGTTELERVKVVLEPIRPPAATKPRARDPQKARVSAALRDLRRGV